MPGERGSDVFSYFWEEQKRQKEKLEVFLEEWDEIVKNYGLPPVFQRWEDYGLKLLSHYGEPYGLRFETMEGYGSGYVYKDYGRYRDYVVFYSGIEDADRICDSLFKILGEEEKGQLSYLDSIGICWENALYPKAMIEGGVQKRPPAQIYGVEDLTDAAALKKSVREAYVDYMFNYEAWNLTPEQEAAYGPAYVSRGREARVEDSGSPWSSDYKIKQTENEFGLYIPIYEKDTYQSGMSIPNSSYVIYDSRREIYITVGNAYQLLKAGGTQVVVKEDGRGFAASTEEGSRTFGDEPELKLSGVLELLKEPDAVIELPPDIQDVAPWLFENALEE